MGKNKLVPYYNSTSQTGASFPSRIYMECLKFIYFLFTFYPTATFLDNFYFLSGETCALDADSTFPKSVAAEQSR